MAVRAVFEVEKLQKLTNMALHKKKQQCADLDLISLSRKTTSGPRSWSLVAFAHQLGTSLFRQASSDRS